MHNRVTKYYLVTLIKNLNIIKSSTFLFLSALLARFIHKKEKAAHFDFFFINHPEQQVI